MVYYEDITPKQKSLLKLFYSVFSGISFIPYLSLLLAYCFEGTKDNFTMIINLQLCIASMMHSASYLLPTLDKAEKNSPLCLFQALLISLSDICSIVIATSTVFFSYLNFISQKLIEKRKKFYLIMSCIFCWIIPLIICIIVFIYGDVQDKANTFCRISNQFVIYAYFGVLFIFYIIFFTMLLKIVSHLKQLLSENDSPNLLNNYISIFKKLASVVCLTFCVLALNLGLNIVDFLEINLPGQVYFYFMLIAQIGELISCPAYVVL